MWDRVAGLENIV